MPVALSPKFETITGSPSGRPQVPPLNRSQPSPAPASGLSPSPGPIAGFAGPMDAMILCVTLNPCLDKTLTVPDWRPGDNVRGTAVRELVGGKGNNVARALTRLGRSDAIPILFLGGPTGDRCERMLRDLDHLHPRVIPTQAETRVILTARTGETPNQTAFFDPDPPISDSEAATLLRQVEDLLDSGNVRALALSGSSPCETTHGLFSDLIALAQARQVPAFLDTYGPALESIWGFWPDVIQLNRREASAYIRSPRPGLGEMSALLDRWARHGVACAVVTDGPGPVLARIHDHLFRLEPPRIPLVNPIGSGDSLLAGLLDGWLKGLAPQPLLQRAVACGAANASTWDAGDLDPDLVEELIPRVRIEPIR